MFYSTQLPDSFDDETTRGRGDLSYCLMSWKHNNQPAISDAESACQDTKHNNQPSGQIRALKHDNVTTQNDVTITMMRQHVKQHRQMPQR